MKKAKFKYHPNVWKLNIFTRAPEGRSCQCCGKVVEYYYQGMYTREKVECICPNCITNGKAAKKFNGDFIQDAEYDKVSDKVKVEELFNRTPGYISWQGEYWLACCDDFCQFIGEVGMDELNKMGIAEEVISQYERDNKDNYYDDCREYLGGGLLAGYLFQCISCGKYRLWVDAS